MTRPIHRWVFSRKFSFQKRKKVTRPRIVPMARIKELGRLNAQRGPCLTKKPSERFTRGTWYIGGFCMVDQDGNRVKLDCAPDWAIAQLKTIAEVIR